MKLYELIVRNMRYSEEDLIKKREEKKKERGGFKEGAILRYVK